MTSPNPVPLLDEHTTTIDADAGTVWLALLHAVDRSFSGRFIDLYASAVGARPPRATGPRPLAEGSTVPGFHIINSVPGSELVLAGRHRFSSYVLTFRVRQIGPERTTLRAESRATFPGPGGALYRLLVVGSGGHVALVRRMLGTVQKRAELPEL